MLTYRLNGRNEVLTLLLISTLLVGFTQFARAQGTTSPSRVVGVGDTFIVNRPVESSFHAWELASYDVRKLSLQSKRPADTIGNYQFTFEALESGEAELVFERYLRTALSTEKLETYTLTVTVQDTSPSGSPEVINEPPEITRQEPPDPQPVQDTTPEITLPEDDNEQQEENQGNALGIDWSVWNHVEELIETENYPKARELIQEQAEQAAGSARWRWKELEARTYMQQEQYAQAITVWESLVTEYPDGPQAKWLLKVAEAHRKNGADGQAELALLEIRHRHSGSPRWPTAMKQLSNMAREQGEYDRARRILERARSQLSEQEHPEIIMALAEIYDKFPTTRNYYKAVKLYRTAAMHFDQSDTRSQNARDRAEYLRNNFLNFGIQ